MWSSFKNLGLSLDVCRLLFTDQIFKNSQCVLWSKDSAKHLFQNTLTVWKVSKYGVISSPYFPVFGLNTEIYEINIRIQSKYWKVRTRNNSVLGHFSRSHFRAFQTFGHAFEALREYRKLGREFQKRPILSWSATIPYNIS